MEKRNTEKMQKPKLVFFQWRYDQGLSKFVVLHRQQHIKCLSEFFEVIVINEDCDYQQICDEFQPDLTLFESGVANSNCYRPVLKNIKAFSEIPKLGLHNGDAWCDARAAFLSDMEHWGIETFFSICTTTAEHIPEIAEQLFVWPNFIDPETYRDYGLPKLIPVLFSGVIDSTYAWRQKIYKIISKRYPSLTCPHLGYVSGSEWRMMYGEKYARTINASWFMPTCGTVEKEIVRKHFEIPASKSCLITEKTPIIEAAGFADMKNCVFADESDVLDKLDYLFQNLDELEKITDAGYQLVHSRHTLKQRDQIFQWFNLYKNLRSNQTIVQSGPFGSLIIKDKSSEIKSSHIICNGLVIELLKQGDEKLWLGKYNEAEAIYLKCFKHIHWSAEVKLRLTLCKLYKGNSEAALSWILQPIQRTLVSFKAIDPDPVEWAYFIISVLCSGNLNGAIKCAEQFPSLCHPELDRIRWVVKVLKNKGSENVPLGNNSMKRRHTFHQLPNRSFKEWIDQLCIMLEACKQWRFSKKLKNLALLEQKRLSQKNVLGDEIVLPDQANRFDREPSSNSTEVALSLISQILKLESNKFSTKFKTKLKVFIKKDMVEFLKRYIKKNKIFFCKIQELLFNDLD